MIDFEWLNGDYLMIKWWFMIDYFMIKCWLICICKPVTLGCQIEEGGGLNKRVGVGIFENSLPRGGQIFDVYWSDPTYTVQCWRGMYKSKRPTN